MVPVYVLNRDTAPIDVRVTTAFGEHKISKIAPARRTTTASRPVRGRCRRSATVAAYKWENGKGHYSRAEVGYGAASCVVKPRLQSTVVDTDSDGRIDSATVKNVGAHTVDARISGPAGSTAKRLAPGQSFTVRDTADRSPVAVFSAYKVVEGKAYYTVETKRP